MSPSTLPIFLLSLFLLSSFSNAQTTTNPQAFIFPIQKDGKTNQYYTNIHIGYDSIKIYMVIDLGGKFAWFNSQAYFSSSSLYRPILCGTPQCRRVDYDAGCVFCNHSPTVPGCTNNTCADFALNPFTGTQGYSGLGQDVLLINSTGGIQYTLDNFTFQYSDPVLRDGLASITAGAIGLGRTRVSLQAELASAYKIQRRFALCIPSSGKVGNMIFGKTDVYRNAFRNISKSLSFTHLIRNPVVSWGNDQIGNFSIEYFIGVKSIRVGTKTLSLNKTLLSIDKSTGGGGTSIRTVRPYTGLERSIYKALVNEFVKGATSMNITRARSVAPFDACFDSKTIGGSKTGARVPTIDFVFKGVYWRFYGSNTMVRVGKDVSCLAFVEGGINLTGPTTSVVVGGYQMENNLLEFDVANKRLGFSSSLLLHHTSCSQFGAS